jgi:hypothetical protein
MIDLGDRERKLLEEMRVVLGPTRADRERIGARIARSIALGALEPSAALGGETPVAVPGEAGTFATGIRGLGGQLLAGTLVAATAFGAGYFTAWSRSMETRAVAAQPTRGGDVRPTEPSLPAERAPADVGKTPAPASASVPRSRPAPAGASAPAASSGAGTVSEEARELQRVDRALRNGMPALALGILKELDERIPRGVLLEERAAARLIARCQNGDAEAPKAAAAWLERHANSVYAPRLRAACAEESGR